MSLAPREKRTILVSAIILVVVLGYLYPVRMVRNWMSRSEPGPASQVTQFKAARSRIDRYTKLTRQLEALKKELKVEVTDAPVSEQQKRLVEKLEQSSGQSKVKINNITYLKARARMATAGSAASRQSAAQTDIQINVTCENDAALVRFIDALESETIPIVVDQISVTATGGRSGEGGGEGGDERPRSGSGRSGSSRGRGGAPKRTIQADLKLHTYVFPEKAEQ